ncbi:MAG: hypothetical protein C0481_18360 [Phenylobacterium sp.]|uniref:hypothetical protein n=1 Tax=Phenylobacterium sp. TaxID=1871053 RepID=UPI0025EB11F9|nr:hypothetical protein [Phenylobacterium sp.]MBA4013830.1 hypothetical protein [Phenylobacterium sp.]
MVSYAARLSPLQGETVWTLEKSAIVERRTGRERRFPLAELRGVTRADRGAVLQFQRRRVTIPALTYGGAMRPLDQADTFETFLAALSDAVPDRPIRRPSPNAEAVLWIMGLMAVGAIAVLLAAGVAGAWLLGVALAARLVFVVILGAAVLPWLRPRNR